MQTWKESTELHKTESHGFAAETMCLLAAENGPLR